MWQGQYLTIPLSKMHPNLNKRTKLICDKKSTIYIIYVSYVMKHEGYITAEMLNIELTSPELGFDIVVQSK